MREGFEDEISLFRRIVVVKFLFYVGQRVSKSIIIIYQYCDLIYFWLLIFVVLLMVIVLKCGIM